MALTVPTPSLAQTDNPGPILKPEKAIMLVCGPVLFPDGSQLTPTAKNASHTFTTWRLDPVTGATLAWDAGAKTWSPAAPVQGEELFTNPGNPPPGTWGQVLLAIGQKDAAGDDKFGSDPTLGGPSYFVTCDFAGRDAQLVLHTGSSSSAAVMVLKQGAGVTGSLKVTPDPPAPATEVKVFLIDPTSGHEAHLDLLLAGSGLTAELAVNNARITITGQGDIELTPASGGKVRVRGQLEVRDALNVQGVTNLSSLFVGGVRVP